MSSDTESARPPKKPAKAMPAPAAEALGKALESAPDSVRSALGGAPVAMPAQRARRIEAPAPRAEAIPTLAGRRANPLFDAPSPGGARAAQHLRRLRQAFGSVASAMSEAIEIHEAVLALHGPDLEEAAAREGFDLLAAGEVLGEFRAFLDRHKPRTATDAPGS